LNSTAMFLTAGITAVVLLGLLSFLKFRKPAWFTPVAKGVAIAGGLAFSWAWFRATTAIENTKAFTINSPFGNDALTTAVTLLVIWVGVVICILSAMYPFSKRRDAANIIRYIGTPFALIQYLWLQNLGIALIGPETPEGPDNGRAIALAFYVGAVIALVGFVWLDDLRLKMAGKETKRMFLFFLGGLSISFPAYLVQAFSSVIPFLQKASSMTAGYILDLRLDHRIVLYIGVAFAVLTYLLLRKEEQDDIHFALIFICLATLTTFSIDYTLDTYLNSSFWPLSIPLHLCNTVMYLIPLCLIFRLKRLYYFTFFINVIGAFFAMTMPNYSETGELLDPSMFVFWVNHFMAFFMPLLVMALNEFERPKLKQFWYAMTAFAGYYLLVLFMNAWLTNYGSCDFFFINSDFITDKAGELGKHIRDFTFTVPLKDGKSLIFYPVYQSAFFVSYIAFTFGMWFLYEQGFSLLDLYLDMANRKEKIKCDRLALLCELDGRPEEEPLDMENTDTLILSHVTKRYGTSSVYAVKDANLEVKGGQIFGFLGPNGAGKSTIIKSIVGIQPISEGTISVCGFDAMRQPVAAKRQLGFVPDHYELYENLTGREYINYMADLYRVSKEDRDARITEMVNLFEMKGSFDNPMKTYSHGMKQKIAIMAALVHDPKVWILDEPLTGLDPDSIYQVKECMKRHAARGNIVFFSSHIIDVVERLCDHIAIIRKGHILVRRTMAEIEASGMPLEEFYMKTIRGELPADEEGIPMDATPVGKIVEVKAE